MAEVEPNDLQSPDYFPFDVDIAGRLLHFVRLNAATFREETFLDGRCKGADKIVGSMPIDDRMEDAIALVPSRRIHFVMHIGYALSTLLTRCLQELTREQVLREPLALTRLWESQPGYLRSAESQMDNATWGRALEFVLRLYGRHDPDQSGVIVKACDRVFPLATRLLDRDPATKILYLYLDVRQFSHAVLRHESRRNWGRANLAESIRVDAHFAGLPEVRTLSDAQCAILLWLGRMRMLEELVDSHSSGRVLAMHGARLAEDTTAALMTVLDFFGLPAVPEELEAVARGPVFRKYAKQQESDFTPDDRRRQMREFEESFGRDIDDALKWAAATQPETDVHRLLERYAPPK